MDVCDKYGPMRIEKWRIKFALVRLDLIAYDSDSQKVPGE